MITLNSEQGLISVENWADIENRPGFRDDLNPAEHKLEAIIGQYIFKDEIKCGLSNCHTLHAKGYIVTTTSGMSTNIGKDCGKKYFGVDFETASKKFDRDIAVHENRNLLWSFSFHIEELEKSIVEMRRKPRGADWVNRKARVLASSGQGCPEAIVAQITSMVKGRTSTLTVPREANEAEIEALEGMQGRKIQRPHVINEPVAEIAGLYALYPENDLRSLLILDLTTNLDAFKKLDIDSLSFNDLRYWAKWVSSVENTMDKAATALKHGNSLLTQQNLAPLLKLLPKGDERTLFRTYLNELDVA